MVDLILKSQQVLRKDTSTEQKRIKQRVKNKKRICDADKVSSLYRPAGPPDEGGRTCPEQGIPSWLTALPLVKYHFYLSKSDFRDAICMRYGWLPERLPAKCVCSENFTIDHALSCPRGAFPTIRHNEIRNLTGILLTEVCHDVSLEPVLQPLGGEVLNHATSIRENEARVDVAARDFWTHGQKAFFDMKVFNPFAKSNQKFALASCFTHHERQKKRAYEQVVVEVENGSFTPLIFSTTGGMGRLASIFYSRLAMMLSEKRQQPFHQQWDGCDASCHSPSCDHPYCASEDQDQVIMSSHDSQSPPTWPPTNHVWPPTKLIQVHSLTYNILSI